MTETRTAPTTPDWSARRGHVVVCGLHDDGLRLVEQLRAAGVDVLVVDDAPDPRMPPWLVDLGVPWLAADAGRAETLTAAGLAGAAAIVCAESDDLRTLATALLARELRPDLRVVAQLRNASVGRALADVGVAVLDVAELAAPSVVESCLQSAVHTVRLGQQDFVVARTTVTEAGTLRSTYGDLAPLALVGTGRTVVSPGRDEVAEAGDTVVLLGAEHAVRAAGLMVGEEPEPEFVSARAPRLQSRLPETRQVSPARYFLRSIDRRIKIALAVLFVMGGTSVGVLLTGYRGEGGDRMSPLDAIYFTVETMTTVGFGDFYFRDQSAWVRVWAIVLMVIGATLVATFFALLTNALVSVTLGRSLGGRRVTGLSDHVVVVGAGRVGIAVIAQLVSAGEEVVALEARSDNRYLAQIRDLDVPVVIADATLPATWSTVRLRHAKAVAVLTSDDLVNIEVGLAVRDLLADRWEDVPVVLRVFERRLAGTLASSFDFRHVRSPATLAAPWFAGAALGLDVVQTLYVAGLPMLVARLVVAEDSALAGTTMAALPFAVRVVLLAHADGTQEDLPRRDTRFAGGDTATLIGPYEDLLRLLRSV